MPQPLRPPRLFLRKRKDRPSVWVILNSGKEIATGCAHEDRRGAEAFLAGYLATKHSPRGGPSDPADYSIADALIRYGGAAQGRVKAAERIGYALPHLARFWTGSVDSINRTTCAEYTLMRRSENAADGTIIRELGVLAAAVNALVDEKILLRAPAVRKPPKPPARERYLTKAEAHRLIDMAETMPKCEHLPMFILFGVATGTRASAILALQWRPNTVGGCINLQAGVIYRRGVGERETNKRRPPLRISDNLRPYLEEERTRTKTHLIEDHRGNPIAPIRKSFAHACAKIGLTDVSPHVLRHTWALQGGSSIYEVAGMLGDTVQMIEKAYGHHCPNHLRGAVDSASDFLKPRC